MPIIKTEKLEGAALDWAAGKASGLNVAARDGSAWLPNSSGDHTREFCPTENWAHGGPMIDKHRVDFEHLLGGGVSAKCMDALSMGGAVTGETHLIAACRAIVGAVFGPEVELPDDILQELD